MTRHARVCMRACVHCVCMNTKCTYICVFTFGVRQAAKGIRRRSTRAGEEEKIRGQREVALSGSRIF